ncbi:MAG: hypothetical protein JW705_01335, partial [Methanosarcinaceae archaeon]|nr:hypothetical protein [Methanosarcinaceae archaeon]
QAASPIKRLGTIMPGESSTASFGVYAEGQAVEKTYGINSEIKYLDADAQIAYSGNLKVGVGLVSSGKGINVAALALLGIFVIMAVIAIRYFGKNQKNKERSD